MKYAYSILFIISLVLAATLPATTIMASEVVSAYVEPASLELKPGEEFIVSIKIDPRNKGISGGEVKVDFNPDAFKCIDISPGNILGPSPLVGFKEIDDVKGSIRYAIARVGRTEPPTPSGVFAEIRFKVKSEANTGTHTIELVRIGLADEKFNNITDISVDNGFVKVKITGEQSQTTTVALTVTTTTYTSSQYAISPYYTYTTEVIVQTQSTIYLLLAIEIIVLLMAVVGVLAVSYLRGGRRRKPRVLRVE
jgi:hypothetical protein